MSIRPPEKNDRDFFRVVQWSAALSMGSMAAFLYSLKQVHPSIRLEPGFGALLIFLGAGTLSWWLCGLLAKASSPDAPDSDPAEAALRRQSLRRWLALAGVVFALGTVAAFAYSLKDVSPQNRREVIEGTVIAGLVLAAGGWFIRKAFQFFEAHSQAELDNLREQEQDDE